MSRKNGSLSTFVTVCEWVMKAACAGVLNQGPLSAGHGAASLTALVWVTGSELLFFCLFGNEQKQNGSRRPKARLSPRSQGLVRRCPAYPSKASADGEDCCSLF